MRTLLITNSYDATSDILINNLGAASFIRLNFDLPRDWSITLTPTDLTISSIHGSFNSDNISKCIWRKPFISKPEDVSFCEKFTQEEWKYTLYEIALLMQDQGKLYMNFPFADYQVGKLKQQRHATDVCLSMFNCINEIKFINCLVRLIAIGFHPPSRCAC